MPATLLAIDTSTERLALSLAYGDAVTSLVEPGAALASSRLIPAVLQLLQQAKVSMAQLDAIAFGAGPGAFTGLRTACSVAQGLAFAANKPVLPLDSLMLVAEDAAAQARLDAAIWVAMDARMDEIYAAAYERRPGRTAHAADGPVWRVVVPPALYTLPALVDAWQRCPPRWLAGSAITVFGERLGAGQAWTPVQHQVHTLPQELDRGAALARLAQQAWAQGLALAADRALPHYLRDKVAQTTAERAAKTALAP